MVEGVMSVEGLLPLAARLRDIISTSICCFLLSCKTGLSISLLSFRLWKVELNYCKPDELLDCFFSLLFCNVLKLFADAELSV